MKVAKTGQGGKLGSTFKDKRVQLGLAAAAGLGLIVLLRKGNGDTSGAGTGASVNTGTLDSTGTDSYNAIGQLGQAWQDEWNQAFQGFSDQLGDISDQLGKVNGPQQPTTNPAKSPVGAGSKNTAPGWGWYRVKAGDTYAKIAAREHVSVSFLSSLNGGLPRLTGGKLVKVRGGAGPKPR